MASEIHRRIISPYAIESQEHSPRSVGKKHGTPFGSGAVGQGLLDRRHWQEQLEFIRGQGYKPKMLVKVFCLLVLGVHEKSDATCRVEDLHKFFHRCDQ